MNTRPIAVAALALAAIASGAAHAADAGGQEKCYGVSLAG
jgi:uncharacterized membrane protein